MTVLVFAYLMLLWVAELATVACHAAGLPAALVVETAGPVRKAGAGVGVRALAATFRGRVISALSLFRVLKRGEFHMSILGHLFGEVPSGVASHLANGRSLPPSAPAAVEQMCRQAGYAVAGRDGSNVTLHVPTRFGARPVTLVCGEAVVSVVTFSAFDQPAHRVRPELFSHLLTRTAQAAVGGWLLTEHDSRNACFGLRYVTHTAGLAGGYLKFVLDSLVQEANGFDGRLRQAGLLWATVPGVPRQRRHWPPV